MNPARLRVSVSDQPDPSIWSALEGDPTLGVSAHVQNLLATDQQRWSRRILFPAIRTLSLLVVGLITLVKRVLPVAISWHRAIDWLCIRFMRRFVSPEGTELFLRHFVLETNILDFIAVNSGYDDIERPTLRPVDVTGLGNSAVITHDVNVFAVLAGLKKRPLAACEPNKSMLVVPEMNLSTHRRWMNLDIETALYLMNIPFAAFLTGNEYRRAVHSLTLDENLLACLSALTGNERYRYFEPEGSSLLIRTAGDVPRRLYVHAVIHELVHEQLSKNYEPVVDQCQGSEGKLYKP